MGTMFSLFEMTSYKDLIREKLLELKSVNPRYTFDALSRAMNVHKPYLSKVLSQKGNLNSDQIYCCAQYLKLTDLESEYFLLLYQENTSCHLERKKQLQTQIEKLKLRALKSDSLYSEPNPSGELQAESNYFLDPYFALIHMFLLIDEYSSDYKLIATKLNLPLAKVNDYLESLHRLKVIQIQSSKIKVLKEFVRLPENSNLISPFRNLSKMKSLDKISNLPINDYLSLHVFFTSDERTRKKIQKLFLEFLEQAKTLADKSPAKEVYQLNFDLLKWS